MTHFKYLFFALIALSFTAFVSCQNQESTTEEDSAEAEDTTAVEEDSDDLADLETEIVIKRLEQDVNLSKKQKQSIREYAETVKKEVDKLDLVHQSELKQRRKQLRRETKAYIRNNILTPAQADTLQRVEAKRDSLKMLRKQN